MIQIEGLTSKQRALCEIMWNLSDRDQIDQFVRSLSERDQQLCWSLCELMKWAFLDTIESTDMAEAVLARFRG